MYTIYHLSNEFSYCVLENGKEIIFNHDFKNNFLNYLLSTNQITTII
jgi:hypothetical protein